MGRVWSLSFFGTGVSNPSSNTGGIHPVDRMKFIRLARGRATGPAAYLRCSADKPLMSCAFPFLKDRIMEDMSLAVTGLKLEIDCLLQRSSMTRASYWTCLNKVYGQLVLLQTRTESTRTFSLVNSYFFATRTLVNSYFFFGQLVLFFGQLVLFLWSTRTF